MDKKQLLTSLLIAALVVLGFQLFFNRGGGDSGNKNQAYKPDAWLVPAEKSSTAAKPELVTLGSAAKGSGYKLALEIDNLNASVKTLKLNAGEYTEEPHGKPQGTAPLTLLDAKAGSAPPFSTIRVTVNGADYNVNGQRWEFVPPAAGADPNLEARLSLKLNKGDAAKTEILEIQKYYRINRATYDVEVGHILRNLTDQQMKVTIEQLGPTDLPFEGSQGDPRNYQGAMFLARTQMIDPLKIANVHGEVAKNNVFKLGSFHEQGSEDHLVWTAMSNRFFTAIVRPLPQGASETDTLEGGRKIPRPDFLREVQIEKIGEAKYGKASDAIVAMRLFGATEILPAKGSREQTLTAFIGPKKRDLLKGDPAAAPGTPAYEYNLYKYIGVIQFSQGGCYSKCTFDWLALIILKSLDGIHYVTRNYGLAIIVLVIVIRLLLHPLTRSSQVNMAKMQRKMAAIQPEIERVKKRYEKDKAKQQQALMEVYRENKVNPAGGIMGCLPMLLQMPIWVALYAALQVDIDLRHAEFVPGWITDLSGPDTIARFATSFHVPILGQEIGGVPYLAVNLLPILLLVVFYLQMRMQAKTMPKAADPQQQQMQQMTQWMILIFPVMLYSMPSGLNLYIFTSTIGGLFDTWLVRRHLRAQNLLPNQAS